jgi:DNA transposition AAA+ family ATPase
MPTTITKINGTIAPLSNVSLFAALLDRLVNAPQHLPRIGTFYGPSGFGKTFSATYGAHRYNAGYVEFGDSWTKRRFLQAVCVELGMDTSGTNSALSDRIVESLALNPRPMIVDEADIAMRKGCLELIREIHDKAGNAWALLGEEKLPSEMALTSERFHNRVLAHQAAQPVTLGDTVQLAHLWCPDLKIAEDLLQRILDLANGRVRRVVVNLDGVRETCAGLGLESIDLATWGNRELFTGSAPVARKIAK